MRISFSVCKQEQPTVNFLPDELKRDSYNPPRRRKDKVVFIMGATGTGKSRLSIDLATSFPAEIVNSDKIQVYEGLDIVTNKVTKEEQCGIPHHLLGMMNPDADFTADDFLRRATTTVESIVGRDKIPIIVGGSNSFIEAMVDDKEFRSKYECCFLWVDVALLVLHSFISERVDRMVELGLVEEVRRNFDPKTEDYSRGIRRAIGVPELDRYLRAETSTFVDEKTRVRLLEEAIELIKVNTCKLARGQLQKIHRLQSLWAWDMYRMDATEVFRHRGARADEVWNKLVAGPGKLVVAQFLLDAHRATPTTAAAATTTVAISAAVRGTALATATR